jgi:hypothetical protein
MKRAFCAIAMFLALATIARADIFKAEFASEDAEVISNIVVNGAPVIVREALGSFDLWYVQVTDRGPEVVYAGLITSYDVTVAPRGRRMYHTTLYSWDDLPQGTTSREIVDPVYFSGSYFDADGRVFELSFWHQNMHRPGY